MSARQLLLVRHATAAAAWAADCRLCGWFDPPLGMRGLAEARALAERLRTVAEPPWAVYASPLRRAWQTAAPIGDVLETVVQPVAELKEINCGALDGVRLRALRAEHAGLWARNMAQDDDDFRWPGGESYREFRERVRSVLDRLAGAHAAGSVVVVTHSGVVTQALGVLRGWPAARWDRERPCPAAITPVEWRLASHVGGSR